MLCFSGFELYSRWVPLLYTSHEFDNIFGLSCREPKKMSRKIP